jgi:HEAT repeat protein
MVKAARIKISGEGLDSAIEPLKNPSAITEWRLACEVAGELGTNAAPAVPLLVANLQYTNRDVQSGALWALGGIHTRPDLCLPAMTPFLSSSSVMERLPALLAVSAFGRAATQWVSTSQITPFLTDYNEFTRKTATNTLRRLYPEAAAKLSVK